MIYFNITDFIKLYNLQVYVWLILMTSYTNILSQPTVYYQVYILVDSLIAHITIYIQECQQYWDRSTSITITVIKSRTICTSDKIWKLVIRREINNSNIWIRSELISTYFRQRILLKMNLNLKLPLALRKMVLKTNLVEICIWSEKISW